MRKILTAACLVSIATSGLLWAGPQQTGSGGTGTTGTARPTTPTTGRLPNARTTPDVQMPRTLFLTGNVMMADGTPPPESIRVELMCNGQVVRQTLSSIKGEFHFELGSQSAFRSTLASASVGSTSGTPGLPQVSNGQPRNDLGIGGAVRSSGLGRFDMNSCTIRIEPLPGYKSNNLRLGFRSVFDKPQVGTIVLNRVDGVEGTIVSLKTLAAPKKARKAYEKAQKILSKKKPKLEKAKKKLDEAVKAFPEFAAAWHLLGQVRLGLEDRAGARTAFYKAVETDEKFIPPYLSLSKLTIQSGLWKEAASVTSRLLKLDPSLPTSRYYHAVSQYYVRGFKKARESLMVLRESGSFDLFPMAYYILGDILARGGEIDAAANEFKAFLELKPPANLKLHMESKLAEWEKDGLIGEKKTQKVAAAGSQGSGGR